MNALKEFVLSICVVYILQAVLLILAPEKYKSTVKLSSIVIILTVIISKLSAFDSLSVFDGITGIQSSYIYDESDKLVVGELESKIADYLYRSLLSNGIESEKVEVNATIDNERCISITKVSVVLNRDCADKESYVVRLTENLVGDVDVDVSFSEE